MSPPAARCTCAPLPRAEPRWPCPDDACALSWLAGACASSGRGRRRSRLCGRVNRCRTPAPTIVPQTACRSHACHGNADVKCKWRPSRPAQALRPANETRPPPLHCGSHALPLYPAGRDAPRRPEHSSRARFKRRHTADTRQARHEPGGADRRALRAGAAAASRRVPSGGAPLWPARARFLEH